MAVTVFSPILRRIGSSHNKVVSIDMCSEHSFDEVKLKKTETKDPLIAADGG